MENQSLSMTCRMIRTSNRKQIVSDHASIGFMDKGRLIAIEGTPGAGKTTVCDRLRNDLERGFRAHFAPVLLEPSEWSSEQKYQQPELIDKMDRWYLAEDERRARSFRSY